jgi:hypothetical protein
MKRSLCFTFAFLALVGYCPATEPPPPAAEPAVEAKKEAAEPAELKEKWLPLFDGKTLTNWSAPDYAGGAEVSVEDGNIVIGRGETMTGIKYEKPFPGVNSPKSNYELRYEARRTSGSDFFAACTFPVKDSFCTFVNGGWSGSVTGLSSINGFDASENATTSDYFYSDRTWYRFRIKVTDKQVQIWVTPQNKEGNWTEEKSVVEIELNDNTKLSIRSEMDSFKPLGFCTWYSEGQLRNIEWRVVE